MFLSTQLGLPQLFHYEGAKETENLVSKYNCIPFLLKLVLVHLKHQGCRRNTRGN